MKLSGLSAALGARLDPASSSAAETEIIGVAGIESAGPGHVTFIANPKYVSAAKTTRASAVLVSQDFSGLPSSTTSALRVRDPYIAFAKAIELFYTPPRYAPGVHSTACIDSSAKVGRNAHIGPYVCIGPNVVIGDDCVLLAHVVIYEGAHIGNRFFAHSHAVIREHCHLGDNIILQNGAIVGADGFGFAKEADKRWYKIMQSGRVVLENDVEVQANACVDRASVGETHVSAGAKIDNLVQVGHGSSVGENTLLCAQVGLAGSTHVGRNVILAGQVGVAGHCTVGDDSVATAQSGIPNDVPAGQIVSGYPAIENKQWLKSVAVFNRLPELAKTVRTCQSRGPQKD